MAGPLLRAEGIVKSFGLLRAVDGATVEVRRGSLVLLAGPNGSGKTTLLNVLSGFLKPDAGRVYFEGRDITDLEPFQRARLGVARTFQTPRIVQRLTVLDNVAAGRPRQERPALWGWRIGEARLAEEAYRLLELVRLESHWDRAGGQLSGGQMKLLEVARALMSGARLILMDEPAAGLHPVLARELFARLKAMTAEGLSVLLVEHRLDLAAEFADYAYFMHEGRVVAEGKPREVFSSPMVAEAYLGR